MTPSIKVMFTIATRQSSNKALIGGIGCEGIFAHLKCSPLLSILSFDPLLLTSLAPLQAVTNETNLQPERRTAYTTSFVFHVKFSHSPWEMFINQVELRNPELQLHFTNLPSPHTVYIPWFWYESLNLQKRVCFMPLQELFEYFLSLHCMWWR